MKNKINIKVGSKVRVTKDDGSIFESTVKYAPWQLGHGQWVIGVNGIAGGYALERVEEVKMDDETTMSRWVE